MDASDGAIQNEPLNLLTTDDDSTVYVLNKRGERFIVGDSLKHELEASGEWHTPDKMPTDVVNGMALRYKVESADNLAAIQNETVGNNLLLVKGDGAISADSRVLQGNGAAIYAVNDRGEKFHVTEVAYNKLMNENSGMPPLVATTSQSAVDAEPITGLLNVAGSTLVTDSTPVIMDKAVTAAASVLDDTALQIPHGMAAGTMVNPSEAPQQAVVAPSELLKIRIVTSDEGEVFAVNSQGLRFKVTPELVSTMASNGTWKEPELVDKATFETMPVGSKVELTNMEQLRTVSMGPEAMLGMNKTAGTVIEDQPSLGSGGFTTDSANPAAAPNLVGFSQPQ